MKILISVFFLASFQVMGADATQKDSATAFGGVKKSDWRNAYRESGSATNPNGNSTSEVVVEQTQEASIACTADQQTSLTYKFFLSLLVNEKMSVVPNSEDGTLSISTGKMVGNCNSMLSFGHTPPQDGRSHLVQIGIKRPNGCTGDVCEYDAYTGESGVAVGSPKKVSVAPNYEGFVQCLKDTGALNEDMTINGDSIVLVEENRIFSGLTDTDQVWFYSHGPLGAKDGGVYSGNKKKENTCRYYEDIKEGGLTFYSKYDANRNRKKTLFDEICKSGDYRLIEQHLPDFGEFVFMKNILEQVRNLYLEKEVKDLHKELAKKNGDGKLDYSELDADKYQRVIGDFYSKIIVPKRIEIERLIREIQETPDGREKKKLKDDLNKQTKELLAYAKAPYLNYADFENMREFLNKAPLHKEAWREATISLYGINKTAFYFQAFNESLRKKANLDNMSISQANEMITADVKAERKVINELGELAEDHDLKISDRYQRKAERIEEAKDEYEESARVFYESEMDYLYNHCYNPSKYWINRQRCAAEVQANIADYQDIDQQIYDQFDAEAQGYREEATLWSGYERRRDQAYGLNPSRQSTARRSSSSANGVDPRALRQPNYQDNWNQLMARMNNGNGQNQGWAGNTTQRGYDPNSYQTSNGWQFRAANRGPAGWNNRTTGTWGGASTGTWGASSGTWGAGGQQYYAGGPQYADPTYNYHLRSNTQYGPMNYRSFGYP